MFDKNLFKSAFRLWSEQNPMATLEEVKDFCTRRIPCDVKEQYSWLEEQSTQWFLWKQENLKREMLKEFAEFDLVN